MLLIKSKFKIAKRLGAGIFEQTQTQKFALSEARSKVKRERRGGRGGGDFGRQLLEKQRVRYTYGLSEKQLSNYAEKAFSKKDPSAELHRALEMRADSTPSIAPDSLRRAARLARLSRTAIIKVNGKRITAPRRIPRQKRATSSSFAKESARARSIYRIASKAPEDKRPCRRKWLSADLNLLASEVKAGEPQYMATS